MSSRSHVALLFKPPNYEHLWPVYNKEGVRARSRKKDINQAHTGNQMEDFTLLQRNASHHRSVYPPDHLYP